MQSIKHILAAWIVVLALSIGELNAEDRKVVVEWNPDCKLPQCTQPSNGSYVNLVYVKLTGNADTLHILYSTIRSFSVQLIKTNNTAKMQIDWDKLLSENTTDIYNSIKFSESVIDSAGYEIASIYEFNDPNGKADLAQTNETRVFRTQELIWDKFNTSGDVSGFFKGRVTPGANSSFQFAIRYPGKDSQRDAALPHLLLNSDSSSIEFIIDHIEPRYNMSKFGLNVIYLTEFEKVTANSIRTIDDEYTPGTFKLWNAEVADDTMKTRNHLQWKPIFYYETPKSLESSTLTKKYDLKDKSEASTSALGLAFYQGGKLFTSMNVSFGLEGSEKDVYFYKQSNYTSWTFSVGVGKPPEEKMSFIVTLVIIVGFGLPAVVILIGLVVMVVKKIKGSRNSDFQPL